MAAWGLEGKRKACDSSISFNPTASSKGAAPESKANQEG